MNNFGIKTLVGLFALTSALQAGAAVAAGSCMKNAISLNASQSVTLVDEYDPEFKEYYGSGVRYYKVTLRKGQAYTIWMNGGSSADMQISVDVDWALEDFPSASFYYVEYANGIQAAYMDADAWSDDDPASFTYYVMISGEIGQQAMLYATQGIMSFTQVGEEGNPKRLTFSDSQVTDAPSLIDGDYFYIASLEAGRKYMIRTSGATSDGKLGLSIDPPGDWTSENILEYTNDVSNTSWYVYPTVTQDYIINVSGGNGSTQGFKLKYRSYPTRLPGSHPNTKLREEDGYAATVIPGRVVADTTYYDNVIDESLCRVKLPAGEKWAFETVVPEDASNGLRMVVYDVNGNILRENTTVGNGSLNCRAVISTTYDGWYYVGVCRPDLQYWDDQPTDGAITVFAYPATDVDPPDDYDTADDSYAGAELVTPLPAAPASSAAAVGYTSGIHELNVCDWYDYFAFAGRAGVTYALKATFATSETTSLKLGAKLYKLVNGSLVKVSDTIGSISPDGTDEVVKALSFTADANAMYYVRISVADGVGLDFPPYQVHAIAYMEDGTELALVQGKTKGVNSTWFFKDDATGLYSSGATVAVPLNSSPKMCFTPVAGYSTPEKRYVELKSWGGDAGDVAVEVGIYNDEFDPADDVESGFVTIEPASGYAKAKRTLWTGDEADWFRVRAAEGYFYNFYLTDTTQDGVGDAVFSIKHNDDTTNLVENVIECRKVSFDTRGKGKYNIRVHHGTAEKEDTAYRLYYQAVNVGKVGFAVVSNKVSEAADYVDVVVKRTASEGVVRVNYATEAETAQPGREYYPTNGVLEWAAGDMADKTVRVRLIPDLEEKWEESPSFRIRLWPMSADSLKEDEYPALLEADVATVKVKENAAKAPGTIIAEAMGGLFTAGDKIVLAVRRQGGSDGRIAVQVKTQPGTALAGRDYIHVKTNMVWDAGDDAEKTLEIQTLDAGAVSSVSFNVKLVPQSQGDYADCEIPAVPKNKLYFNLASTVAAGGTVADAVAREAESGVALDVKRGDWYLDGDGAFRCLPPAEGMDAKIKFRVPSAGFVVMCASVVGAQGLLRYMVTTSAGDTPWIVFPNGEKLVIPVTDPAGALIQIKLKNTDGNTYASFADQGGAGPFRFVDLSTVKASSPENLATLAASDVTALTWTEPAGGADGVWYRVRIGDQKAKSSKITEILSEGTKDLSCKLPEGMPAVGKTYWWMLDYAYSEEASPDFSSLEWIEGPRIWSFTAVSGETASTVVEKGWYDAYGDAIAAGSPIKLVQGVAVKFYLAADSGEGASAEVLDGALPPGVDLKGAKCKFQGAPTASGDYSALVQVTTVSGQAKTLRLDFTVDPIGVAAGAFSGMIREDGTGLEEGFPRIGRVKSLAISETGAIYAQVKVAGMTYVFSADSLDSAVDGGGAGYPGSCLAMLSGTSTINDVVYTNRMELTVASGDPEDGAALGVCAGEVSLVLNVLSGGEVQEVSYRGELVRDNTANEQWLAAAAQYEGYYTVSLVPFGVSPAYGVPCGNGYLTLQLDGNGMAAYAGFLADGTALSGSSQIALRGDLADPTACSALVPIGMYSSPWSFGGTLKLDWAKDGNGYAATVVDSRVALEWNKDGVSSSFDGQGFRIELRPTGGWYNTLVNLQRYYLDKDFSVEAQQLEGLPAEMLPVNQTYSADTMPHGVNVLLGRNSLTPDARALVTQEGESGLYDLAASVNPWKVKTSFVPETGLLTGTFKAWAVKQSNNKQKEFATLNHYGVLLMNRDAYSPLDDDVWTAGFYLLPVTSDWTFSLPFNIRALPADRDWTEAEIPQVE